MIRSKKKITFSQAHPITPTEFPAEIIHNRSLAKTASTLAIFVPLYSSRANVHYVEKEEAPKGVGGEDLGLQKPSETFSSVKDMKGKGTSQKSEMNDEEALYHPIKVKNKELVNSFVSFFFS